MNDTDKENVKRNFDQLQTLGQILTLVQTLNIDELEAMTNGSHLGEVVKLLKNIKNTLNLAIPELEKEEDNISIQLADYDISNEKNETSEQKINHNDKNKPVLVDYLTNVVFADTECFPDRKTILDFFKEYFDIDYNLKKESRKDLVNKLCKLLLDKNLSLEFIGDALLKRTNHKHGSALKEKPTSFLKSWYEAIEKM